jgi:uncharacterized protein involved in exopolysaccharide biosynthesis
MLGIAPDSNVPIKVGTSAISLRDIVFMLFRRRWIVLAVSVPIIVVGGMSLFQQTGSYTAACRVLVELSKVDLPRWNTAGRNIDYDRELSTMFNIAMSIPVADMAATTLRDSIPVLRELMPQRTDLDKIAVLREFLLERLDVSAVGESNILEFRFSSAKPRISLMAVGAMRDAFVNYQVHSRKNLKAIAYYNEQLQAVQGQVDSLLIARSRILTETGYFSIIDQMRNEIGQMAEIQSKLLETTANRRTLEMEFKTLKSLLNGDPLAFPIGMDESRSSTLVYWRNQVSKHQDTLNSILSIHTDDSIPARRQRSIVERALERLHLEEVAYVESVGLQLRSALGREQTLRDQVETLRLANARGPEAESRISRVDVEMESLRSLLRDIQGKLGEVRLNQMADERVSSVTSLTDPEMVLSLSGGKTMVYFSMIAFFAIALGIVVALILESMDHRIYHPKDIEENLKLPVFASVTRTD